MSSHARNRTAAGAVAAFVIAGAVLAASPAQAATTDINPFASSNGFTIVANGDASLGNGELEGSIAVTGALSSTSGNYPILHQVAGSAAYTVPTVDGQPVRVLAGSFTGTGNFDLTNSNAPAGSAEEAAIAKLVSTSGLTAGARGGGVGPAAGRDFTRLTAPTGGVLDLKALPWNSSTSLSTVKTVQSSVADYVDVDGYDAVSTCLADTYDTDLVNMVDANVSGGLAMPGPFATDRPNVLDYADIAGTTIKQDNFAGYLPTAEAPLIIRVAAGTTTVSTVNIEGWSAGLGQQQGLASYIMFDLSAVTGPVTIDGVELGAIYAPNADVTFTGSRTHNGQWITGSFTSQGGGELHHYLFLGSIPCGTDENGDADAGANSGAGAGAGANSTAGSDAGAESAADGSDAGADAGRADAAGAEADAQGTADVDPADADADSADTGADSAVASDATASATASTSASASASATASAAASTSATSDASGASSAASGESASGLATTGAGVPFGLIAAASVLVAIGVLLALRARRARA